MRVCFLIFSLYIGVFFPYTAISQDHSRLFPEKPIRDLVLHQWTAEDGLISNNLTSVNHSSEGYIWVTCFNGALRFDGSEFQLFDLKNLELLRSNAFLSSYEDDQGNIWFATQASGIVRYADWEFHEVPFNHDIPRYIRSVYRDNTGKLWIGSNNSGLYVADNNIVKLILEAGLRDVSIMDISGDKNGIVYFAVRGKGLFKYEKGVFTNYNIMDGLISNFINDIYVRNSGDLIIGTVDGLSFFNGEEFVNYDFLRGIEINYITEDEFGSIWIATEMGLGRINEEHNLTEFFRVSEGLPTRQISGLTFDHEGNLWLSTKKGGLIQLKNGDFINYTRQDGLALDRVNTVVEYGNGVYYIGSDDGEINILKEGKLSDFSFNTSLKNNGIRDIAFDQDGSVWIASYFGLLQINGDSERLYDMKSGLPSNDIRRILIDSKGFMWLGSRSGGAIKMKNGEIIDVINKDNGLKSNYILAIEEDRNGNICLGTNGGGITSIGPDGELSTYTISDDASGELFFNITIDEDNVKWLSTNIGIFRFDGNQFIKIPFDSNYQNDTFFDLLFDSDGNIWITSNIGLYRALLQDVNSFLAGNSDAVPLRLFDHTDGLVSKECTGATRSLMGSDGKLYIPTLGGLAIIDPEVITMNDIPPIVYVTDFQTDRSGSFISEDFKSGSITISPGNYRYIFKYTALSYEAPEKVRFMYKLDGIDSEWIYVWDKREVQYTNLPPGRYEFMVKACNNDGYWNEEGYSIKLRIKPWLYQRIEFWAAIILIIGVSLWIIYQTRVNKIEKRNVELKKINDELDKFVYSASHDLKAPLASVIGLVNIARKDNNPESTPLYLDMIEKSVHKLEGFIKDIIDYSRNTRIDVELDKIDFKKIIDDIFEDLQYMDKEGKVRITVKVEEDGHFESDERRISIILNNLISNAYKYHDCDKENQEINVNVEVDKNKTSLWVSDNGLGIPDEHIKKIFEMFYRGTTSSEGSGLGLFIVRETVDKIRGKIGVESTVDKGTTFILELPSLEE